MPRSSERVIAGMTGREKQMAVIAGAAALAGKPRAS